jgi:hypothetical protein
MQFSFADRTVGKLYVGETFALSPTTQAVAFPQPRKLPDSGTPRERFDIPKLADDGELHGPMVPRPNLQYRPALLARLAARREARCSPGVGGVLQGMMAGRVVFSGRRRSVSGFGRPSPGLRPPSPAGGRGDGRAGRVDGVLHFASAGGGLAWCRLGAGRLFRSAAFCAGFRTALSRPSPPSPAGGRGDFWRGCGGFRPCRGLRPASSAGGRG